MAGYFLYSLDWNKVNQLIETPSREQLLAFAKCLADELDKADGDLEEGDSILEWPVKTEELCEVIKERLSLSDWYGDLSDEGKEIWQQTLWSFFCDNNMEEFGFRVESNSIYWDVIEIIREHHNMPGNQIVDDPLSHFGNRPYRYHLDPNRKLKFSDWTAWHSMHTPEEVKWLLQALTEAESAVRKAKSADVLSDYEDELMPAIEKIAKEGRMLFVHVDT
jgi:hypothetical protein